jgi:AraC-like DNA-binding protein/ligand-binding sensor protein
MRRNSTPVPVLSYEKTNPILLKALELMTDFTRATEASICVHDHNYMPITELTEEMLSDRNICNFCTKYQKNIDVKNHQDLCANPCREMHLKALSESHRFGGIYTYICPLKFMFWTSPIYLNEKFIGALMGSGLSGTDTGETCARMYKMCNGTVSEAELKRMLGRFPQGNPQKIKAMAELMLICAQSLSIKSEGCHAAIRRRAKQQSDLSLKIEELKNHYPPGSPRPEYPLDRERTLLEALRQGDTEKGRQTLNEILAFLCFMSPDDFKYLQFRAIELTVLLSRVDAGFTAKTMLETNNLYIKSIQETVNIEELTDVLYGIVNNLAEQTASFRGIHHASALKKAEYYIWENFTRKISLDEIAKAAGFSAPYFSTIFKEEMGENLLSYLNRLRVEKAGFMLTETNLALSKIARACGFEDQSWFSKIFKLYTGITPGKYRSHGGKPPDKHPANIHSADVYQKELSI